MACECKRWRQPVSVTIAGGGTFNRVRIVLPESADRIDAISTSGLARDLTLFGVRSFGGGAPFPFSTVPQVRHEVAGEIDGGNQVELSGSGPALVDMVIVIEVSGEC